MPSSHNDLLFPPSVIESLADLRGRTWQALILEVLQSSHQSNEHLAFILMMSKLNGCASCNTDSYRAMQGCAQCSKQFLQRYRGSDDELIDYFKSAIKEIEKYFKGNDK